MTTGPEPAAAALCRTGHCTVSGRKRWLVAVAVLLVVLVAVLPGALQVWGTSQASSAFDSAPGEVIVGFLPDVPEHYRVSLVEQYEGLVLKTNSVLNFVVAGTPDPHAFMTRMSMESGVRYVEPNMTVQLTGMVPDDPYWTDYQWGPKAIRADLAWTLETGSSSVTIAVIDTGVDYTHEDLGNYVSGGYDWVNNNGDPMDDHGHGTFVAGIAAATTNNGIGIAGIAQVNIVAEKVLGSDGSGSTADVAAAIERAANMGADIINLSLGSATHSHVVQTACDYAWSQGVLLVAAAGNDGSEPDYEGGIFYPAAYDSVIAVGSITSSGTRSAFSNWGPEMELAAPGSGIFSTEMDNSYDWGSGTSYAAPHVAGVAALLWSHSPQLTNQELRDILQNTAHDLGAYGWDEEYGYGRVDAYDAIQATPPTVTAVSPQQAYQGQHLPIEISGTGFGGATEIVFGTGITVDSFTVASPTQIDAVIAIDKDAAPGPRDVSVVTPTGTVTLTDGFTVEPNEPPNKPVNTLPVEGATGISLTPTLSSSDFSDADAGDTHAASQWQVTTLTGDYSSPVFDSNRDVNNLTSITLSELEPGTTYYWRVSHQDNKGAWSDWSGETWFRTVFRPAQPDNVSPESDATGMSLSPVLQSSNFSDPDEHGHAASQWQITQISGNYNDPTLDSDRDTVNRITLSLEDDALKSNTVYYWRVRHQNDQGIWSLWSDETSFTTANRAPDQPVNTSPSDGATEVPVEAALQAGDFFDPDPGDSHAASQWQVSTIAGDYASPVFDSGTDPVNLTSIAPPENTLDGSTTYYWRVMYQDNHGKWSDWSKETSFTTMNRPPDQPVNAGPLDGAEDVEVTPTLEASAFSDPDSADTHAATQWQVSAVSGDYDSPIFDSGPNTEYLESILVPVGTLDGLVTYYWRVRYQDSHDTWSDWSEETCFTTLNRPPDQPENLSPEGGSTQVSLTPTLVSSAFSDPDSGHKHKASQWQVTAVSGSYELPAYDSGENNTLFRESITLPSPRLENTTVYYWRVRHQDHHGAWSEWSEETSFMTVSLPPDKPSGIDPEDNASDIGLTPTLQSSGFSDPDEFDSHAASRWQLTVTAGNYSEPLLDSESTSGDLTSLTIPAGVLDYSTTYFWRVQYRDSYGTWSAFSEERTFTTLHSVPDAPGNVAPAAGTTGVVLTPTLEASPFSDPDSGNSHAASQWQLTAIAGDYSSPVFDSGRITAALTSISISRTSLDYGQTYYWRVRHQNDRGVWSEYSAETAFTVFMPDPPLAAFEVDRTSGDGPLTVIFTDLSSGLITSWQWDLNGDGVIDSTDPNPMFAYDQPGQYTVTLTVEGPGGSSTETREGLLEVKKQREGGLFGCLRGEVAAATGGISPAGIATGWIVVALAMMAGPTLVRRAAGKQRR